MGDFNVPRPSERKRPGNGDFLQPAKKRGFSVPLPGSFKNSYYWKTLNVPETSVTGQRSEEPLPAPVVLPPLPLAENRPIEEEKTESSAGGGDTKEDIERKSIQYQELVDECKERSSKVIENISKWLMEVEQTPTESSSKGCSTKTTTKTDFSDTSWLKDFHEETQTSSTFNLNTQLLDEITGRKTREEDPPEVEMTENLSLSPILDMIDANSIQSPMNFEETREYFWESPSEMRIGNFSWD